MPDYRRAHQPGGTFFFTLVTHGRRPLFADPGNVERLRAAVRAVMRERPFEFHAGVVLPDHAHYLWTLPPGDGDFSTRIGRMKVLFTQSLPPTARRAAQGRAASRVKHGDADVWQRRFWEHVIRDEGDRGRHLDYIHYNPVKHGVAACPHAWLASSFPKWVANGCYERDWCCGCNGQVVRPPDLAWASADME